VTLGLAFHHFDFAHSGVFSMIFRWIFIPWLQCELDRYQDRVNNTLKRPDRNKVFDCLIVVIYICLALTIQVLPHGVPNLIYESPEAFGALDFKVRFTT
jgi:hypothetical protein